MFRGAGLVVSLLLMLGAVPVPADGLIDPTRPPWVRAPAAAPAAAPTGTATPRVSELSELELSSIVYSEIRRSARINGRWVGEGEQVDGVQVLRIEPDNVRVDHGGSVQTLRIKVPGMSKQPVTRRVLRE